MKIRSAKNRLFSNCLVIIVRLSTQSIIENAYTKFESVLSITKPHITGTKMNKRARNEIDRTRQAFKSQSRIADYINGKIPLEQMIHKDRIIKPEERHNKRAFLPHINDDVKIVHRKIKDPRTIEVKIDTRRPVQRSKSKITEFDPKTNKFVTPPKPPKKNMYIDFNNYRVLISDKGNRTNAIEFKEEKSDDDSTPAESQLPTPATQSPCNDIVPVISNVNDTAPDTTYYEETLVTKNDEISMLKEKIRALQKSIITKNNVGVDEDHVLDKILESLTHVSGVMKSLKNARDDYEISSCVAQIEDEQDKWFSYVATVSDGMRTLKELNNTLKSQNTTKAAQLREKEAENEHLQKKLLNAKQETVTLKTEKNDYMDMLNASKHSLKLAHKENENLQQQLANYSRLSQKANEQLDMLNKACEKVQIDLQSKEQTAMELEQRLQHEIAQLEAANDQLVRQYEQATVEIEHLTQQSQRNATVAKEAELRYKSELETLIAAKEGYIETLQHEADRLRNEIRVLQKNMSELAQENEQYYTTVARLTNENQSLRDDAKYMTCERKQLDEAITEWCKSECVHDSLNLIEMIDNLKMRMVIAETTYSNRLMENLEQTVKFTQLLGELDQ